MGRRGAEPAAALLIPFVESLPGWHPDPNVRDRIRRFFYAEVDGDQLLTALARYVEDNPLPEALVDGRLAKRMAQAY